MSAHRSLSRLSALGSRLSALGILFLAPVLGAQNARPTAESREPGARLLDSAQVLIAKATPASDIQGLQAAKALLERALTVAPNDPWAMHYLGFALYREATIVLGREQGEPGPLLERAADLFERSARLTPIPESHALRSGALGMMIGSNPLKGMTLGPRSGAEMERALELDPTNPRVWLLRGIGAINTPAMFGGGVDKAEEYLRKSIALFTRDKPAPPAPSWGASEAHTWLGQAYAKQGRKDAARAEYQKALALEPNDMWVRMSLLPALDKKK
jgi:tetratricopeptide (TPR) repeat protein